MTPTLQMICVLAAFLYPNQTFYNKDYQTAPMFCVNEVPTVCMKCHIGIPEEICKP